MNLLEEKLETKVAIRNILFATDFSQNSEVALSYATALSLRYGSTIHLAHVLPEVVLLRPGAPDPAMIGSIYEDAHSGAQERMQVLAERLKAFPHKTYVRHGKVGDVLTEIMREQEIDLFVLGTHGRTGLGKLIMGSVAEEVFRQMSSPVLTVGPMTASKVKSADPRHDRDLPPMDINFHRVLYATDFKSETEYASSYAVSLASEFRSALIMMHVIEDYGTDLHDHPGPIEAALRNLEALVPEQADLRYRPKFVAEYGSPAELILKTAAEYEADLIVLGVRPVAGHLTTHFGGSTAYKVVAGATCPVLTIRG